MFTGLIEEIGTVDRVDRGAKSAKIAIKCSDILPGLKVGDSIAVNGVCLTATAINPAGFTADVMDETVKKTSLFDLKNGSRVNLERAMPADGRFGGHIVAGHVDGIGEIRSINREEMGVIFTIEPDDNDLMKTVVEKGSVTIDGISLTVAKDLRTAFTVSIIPHTIKNTTLYDKNVGDIVNIETDIIGRYVEKLLMGAGASEEKVSLLAGDPEKARAFLAENGF